jgi:hypothetical protein
MYNEKSYTNHIFALKVKRIFLIIFLTIIGCALGILLSFYLVDILLFNQIFKPIIITICTIIFFLLSFLFTAKIQQEILDGYWKIAVLRKLTLISKKLNNLNKTDNLTKSDIIDSTLDTLNAIENTVTILPDEEKSNEEFDSKVPDINSDINVEINPEINSEETSQDINENQDNSNSLNEEDLYEDTIIPKPSDKKIKKSKKLQSSEIE